MTSVCALQLHWDENYCRPAFDVIQLEEQEDEVVVGGGYDKDSNKDMSTLAVDTWSYLFCPRSF